MEKVERLREISRGIAVTTDLIAGFPGEEEDDFEQTLDLMTSVEFDHIFAFIYSDRPDTPASRFPGKVSEPVKRQRLRRALELQSEITKKTYRRLIGRIFPVMVEGYSKNHLKPDQTGRPSDIELSGRTSENRIVNFFMRHSDPAADPDFSKGHIQQVRIERACENSLWGTSVDEDGREITPKGGNFYAA